MSSKLSKLKDTQLFFKNMLHERIENQTEYKEYSKDFSLNLIDYDLYNEDIEKIINIIIKTEKLISLKLRLSNTLTDKNIFNKLLKKISLKRQFISLSFFIKYLNDDLLSVFIEFVGKLENTLTSLKIKIKYDDIQKEEKVTKQIIESMIKNNDSGLTSLKFKEGRFNTEDNLNLLNKYIEKNKNKLKRLTLKFKRLYNDIFTPDISQLEKVNIICCNISSINHLPIEKLNLSYNNIGKFGLENIIENLKKNNCTLKRLNLQYNYLGNDGISLLGECLKYNKSLISLNASGNNILNDGLISFAKNIIYKFKI